VFISGKEVGDEHGAVTSPWDGAVVGHAPVDEVGDVAVAVDQAAAYDGRFTGEQRAQVLTTTARLLHERRDQTAELITRESGICLKDSRREVDRACGNLTVAAEAARCLRGETLEIDAGGARRLVLVLREPVGVVAAITPFNRPLNQVVVKVAPAIAMNCPVVVKPSELTPLSAYALGRTLIEAGLPPEMFAIVGGDPGRIGPALVRHPGVDMVTFTGSVAVGEQVAREAGMRKLLLELGGNDPLIVLADADLDHAARLATAGAFGNAGQSCRGVKRILVAESVAEPFGELLCRRVARLSCGDPLDAGTDVGPLISAAAAAAVAARCESAVAEGARLMMGGDRRGALMMPTVLDHVPPDSELVSVETFGPVAPIIRVSGVEEAIEVANRTEYGLQAGVVTDSHSAFMRAVTGLRVGAVNLMEGPNFDSPYIPFGGVKKSGLGREGIAYAMSEMSVVKTVVLPYPPGAGR
jgi:putative phosphonoacetaldehyde dehydrogenase